MSERIVCRGRESIRAPGTAAAGVKELVAEASADDEALVRRARAGDRAAFGLLVSRYQDRVYRLSYRLTASAADAEEVVQETFLRAYRRLGGFRGEARFSTWLFRIATNTARVLHRGRLRHPTEPIDDHLPRFDRQGRHEGNADHPGATDADDLIDRRRLARRAREALARLPERYRVPFVLRDLEEMPAAEVAATLGISHALVRQRVHRARLMLRGCLGRISRSRPRRER